MKFLAAPALVAATLAAGAATSNVDAFIEAELPSSAAPGVSYAIVDGDTSSAKGFGEAKRASGIAVTADTRFPIGSVTKSFTALAIMQMVESGKLDLDAAVSTYLTAFADGPGADITIRQLLNHTSGYSTQPPFSPMNSAQTRSSPTFRQKQIPSSNGLNLNLERKGKL